MYPVYHAGGALSVIYIVMSLFSTIFSQILLAAELIGLWFTYKKMNLPGWKGIIPFYNFYILFEELWEVKHFWRMIIYCVIFTVSFIIGEVLMIVGGVFSYNVTPDASLSVSGIVFVILGILFFITALVMVIMMIVILVNIYRKTAKAFGLKKTWVWGLFFVPYIMFPIIGFNRKIVYYGPVEHLEKVEQA